MSQQPSFRHYSGTAAENYQRYFVPTIAEPVAADLLAAADLQPGERVLDVACGTGVIACLAAERVGPAGVVVGVDVAPEMIEVARATTVPSGVTIDWREGDAASLPLPEGSFDVVLCQMGLMLFQNKPAAVSEMRRVLVTGGRVALSTPGTINRPMQILADGLARHVNPDLAGFVHIVFSMNDPKVHERLLHDAGFADVEVTVVPTAIRLPPPREFMWQYISLTPMGAMVSQAPEAAQAALEEDVVGQWQESVKESAGTFDQPMVVATGTA